MTKEQLSQLADDVRIPTEVLLDRLRSVPQLPLIKTAISEDDGIAFFFSHPRPDGITITADIEIDADGTVTASVIPYQLLAEGNDVYQSEEEPIELWDVEEEPPYDGTIDHILERFGLPPAGKME